jgi:hypothetical protein
LGGADFKRFHRSVLGFFMAHVSWLKGPRADAYRAIPEGSMKMNNRVFRASVVKKMFRS